MYVNTFLVIFHSWKHKMFLGVMKDNQARSTEHHMAAAISLLPNNIQQLTFDAHFSC